MLSRPAIVVPEAQPLPSLRHVCLAVALTSAGGVLAILGAFLEEIRSGGVLVLFFGAPMIEEAMKPAGVYLTLLRSPYLQWRQSQIVALCALAGLVFGLIEGGVYVLLYVPDAGFGFVLYRFTVTPVLHVLCSGIVGLGLTRGLIDWAAGRGKLQRSFRNSYLLAAGLHAAYNTSVFALAVTGVFEFETD